MVEITLTINSDHPDAAHMKQAIDVDNAEEAKRRIARVLHVQFADRASIGASTIDPNRIEINAMNLFIDVYRLWDEVRAAAYGTTTVSQE